MTKPIVFNYQDYRDAVDKIKELEGVIIRLKLDNEYLKKQLEAYENDGTYDNN